jgi:uncharacterized protein GlcG (DUF336 family)
MRFHLTSTAMSVVVLGSALALTAGGSPAAALESGEVSGIFKACKDTAADTPSPIRGTDYTVMWCAVVDREGVLQLIQATDTNGTPAKPKGSDAWRGSIAIAIAKAWTALAFSSSDVALDSKTVGLLARQDGPGDPDSTVIGTNAGVAPLFGIGDTNLYTRFFNGPNEVFLGRTHQGIVTFAGGQPVYDCGSGELLGGVGVSGDGVDQDDAVAKGAVTDAGFCLTPTPAP